MYNRPDVLSELEENGYSIVKAASNLEALNNNPVISQRLNAASLSRSFYWSLLNNDSDTNMTLSSIITKHFKQILSPLFPKHRFLAGSFLVKPALDYSEFYLHQDWSFTDERYFAPITVWAPITDTDETSGGMFFIKGSHKYFDTIRSTSYETPRFPIAEIGREIIESVPIEKKDILLFNPAVWHGSFPNTHSHARGVFACIILPEEAPFYYYHKHSPNMALRYNVPDNIMESHLRDITQGRNLSEMSWEEKFVPYNVVESDSYELIKKLKRYSENNL